MLLYDDFFERIHWKILSELEILKEHDYQVHKQSKAFKQAHGQAVEV